MLLLILAKKRSCTHIIAVLPSERTLVTITFITTGVDFAGAFDIKSFTGRHIIPCRLCTQAHPFYKCETFKRLPLEKRLRNVVFFRYCYNCLSSSGDRHHTLLHSRSRTTSRAQWFSYKTTPRDANPQQQSIAVRASSSNLSSRDYHCPSRLQYVNLSLSSN